MARVLAGRRRSEEGRGSGEQGAGDRSGSAGRHGDARAPSICWTTRRTRPGCAHTRDQSALRRRLRHRAHFFVINRRYDEGIAHLPQGAASSIPHCKRALRHGRQSDAPGQGGRSAQATGAGCYNAGYQSPETVNSLRLLDSYKNYDTFRTPTTILRLHKKEAALLRPYFQEQFDRALATYEKKYQYQAEEAGAARGLSRTTKTSPCAPWACRDWARLGVTFGYVVAMDSPSAPQARRSCIGPARCGTN